MNEKYIGEEEREECEAQMRAQCKGETLLEKERVVNGALLMIKE